MNPTSDRRISIQIQTSATNPALLSGLQALLRLELISDRQIKQIASQHLQCRLPDPIPDPVLDLVPELGPELGPNIGSEPIQDPPEIGSMTPSRRPVTYPVARTVPSSPTQQTSSIHTRWFQSFMDELSVLWLLFLGVFLVVVSSAVLAASQWQNFSAVGQYLVLFVYTLTFWGAGLWTQRQPNLQLTSRMLQRVTLLLVPINFWAMDGFALWQRPSGWLVAMVSAIGLTLLLLKLLRSPQTTLARPAAPAIVLTTIALSWLHWGWAIAVMPLLASYVGMIGTAIAIIYSKEDSEPSSAPKTSDTDASGSKVAAANASTSTGLPATTLICLCGALLLLGRAILVAQVPVAQMGLAFGLCGAVLVWRARGTAANASSNASSNAPSNVPSNILWSRAGVALVALGWLVSLQLDPPWQPVILSGLVLGVLAERLKRDPRSSDLSAIFLVGLQALWLMRRFAPVELRAALVDRIAAVAGSEGMPFAVVGVTIFPYLLLFLAWGDRFRRRNQMELSRQADFLCLALGAGLTVFSIGNPLMRSLNLTFSALTLGWVLGRRQLSDRRWPYLTQLLIWGAVSSWMMVLRPNLSVVGWLGLTLVGALVEWGLSLGLTNRPLSWRSSAWHTGLVLAVVSYVLCLAQTLAPILGIWAGSNLWAWSLAWWLIPLALMALVQHPRCVAVEEVRWVGIASLFLVQLLMLPFPSYRIAGLGLATLLMGWHSRLLPTQATAVFTVGFAAGFSFLIAFGGAPEQAKGEQWMFAFAAIALLLWGIWASLRQAVLGRSTASLKQFYARASNGWAIAFFLPPLWVLVAKNLLFYLDAGSDFALITGPNLAYGLLPVSGLTLATALLLTLSMAFCLVISRNPAAAWGLAIALEVFLGLGLGRLGAGLSLNLAEIMRGLAIANLGLALLAQLVIEWRSRHPHPASDHPANDHPANAPRSLATVPLAYGAWGAWLGHWPFTAWTGALTLAAAIIALGVSRRHRPFNPVAYVALLGISVGAYELLIYQLSQASGGNVGDGMVLLALLGAGLALGDRLLARWIVPHLQLETQTFQAFTHAHWVMGTLFAIVALLSDDFSQTGGLLWILTMGLLGLYALFQNRDQASGWTDLGLVQGLAALGYGIHLICPWPLLLGWAAAIACPLAALLHRFPWQHLGWSPQPGRRWAALVPVIVVLLTAWDVTVQSLLITAVFYAGLAAFGKSANTIRLSYISLGLVDWVLLRLFDQYRLTDGLWYASLLGATVLYVCQIDPSLRDNSQRETRHWLRCLGCGIVCFTALYQGQAGLGNLEGFGAGLVAMIISFGFILAGISLRIRAFLWVGTAGFVAQVLLQVWKFIQDESLLLWAIGIVLGMILIWIAATFEARRSQIITLINQWVRELESWH